MDLSEALDHCAHGHPIRRASWPRDHFLWPSRIQPLEGFRVLTYPKGFTPPRSDADATDWELAGYIQ